MILLQCRGMLSVHTPDDLWNEHPRRRVDMKRVALAVLTASYALIASMVVSPGDHGSTAFADDRQSGGSDANSLVQNLFGSSDNLAGTTPVQKKTTTRKSSHSSVSSVVEEAYASVLRDWNQQGIVDTNGFSVNIRPSEFSTPTGAKIHGMVQNSTDGTDSVFNWDDQTTDIRFHVNVPQDGLYVIKVDYRNTSSKLAPIERGVRINGKYQYLESRRIVFHTLWRNDSEQFPQDEHGNELPPNQVQVPEWQTQYMMDSTYLSDEPLRFHFQKGDNLVDLVNVGESMQIRSITVQSPESVPGYQEYLLNHPDSEMAPTTLNTYEAEHPYLKSDPYIQAQANANPGVTPYRNGKITLNTLGGSSWQNGGQSVTWKIHVQKSGYYYLAFKYLQSAQINLPVYRTLWIDGQEPFREARRIPFPYTNNWENETIGDSAGHPYRFWLTSGTHLLTLIANPAPYQPIISDIHQVMQEINDLSLQIRKATGNTLDQNRDWDINSLVPNIVPKLRGYAKTLQSAFHTLSVMSGQQPDAARSLEIAADRLNSLADHPEKIPYLYKNLADGSGSVNELLGGVLQALPQQPLLLDKFYVYSNAQLPSPHAGFFRTLMSYINNFIDSFFQDTTMIGAADKDAVTVWVNRPREYVMLMQEMADRTFTKQTGIKVTMMIMPNEQKLILSNAAHETPDVVLGVNNAMPFNMGLRGAVEDLQNFKDFAAVKRRFAQGAMLPFEFNGHTYALPDTQDFWVLFYRKDILDTLKIPIPNTWDDVISILPKLERYGMNFYDPIAGAGGYKNFATTVPFLYQNGGQLYRPDGMHAALDTDANLTGFKLMTKLFTVYGLPLQVPNFYSHFREGDLPIGISNFNTYVQLTAAAPELNGLWGIAPIPGIKDSHGRIERWAPGTGEADMIFHDSNKKEQAWEFLKWWTSEQTQAEFGQKIEAIYGPAFRWNSSNLEAFKQLPWPAKDIQVILEQSKWLEDIPHIPGDYMVERGISDAWNKVVFNGENPRMALDDAELNANREIRVQLEQLGYIDASGHVVKKIHVPTFGK
jgi:ABC-type glycerol-3-phosphate transport system substrate-binding protein